MATLWESSSQWRYLQPHTIMLKLEFIFIGAEIFNIFLKMKLGNGLKSYWQETDSTVICHFLRKLGFLQTTHIHLSANQTFLSTLTSKVNGFITSRSYSPLCPTEKGKSWGVLLGWFLNSKCVVTFFN